MNLPGDELSRWWVIQVMSPPGDESAGDESAGDESAGDESAGHHGTYTCPSFGLRIYH